MKEIWKDIKNFEGLYQVSNLGEVKSLERIVTIGLGNKIKLEEKIMKFTKRSGYYNLVLRKNGKRYSKQVHRLVAEAFISNPENKPQVNHKDFNKLNNNIDNLEWVTSKENTQWSRNNMKHRHKTSHSKTGEQYIYYRAKTKKYRIVVDKKEYSVCNTLEDAIKKRDEILNEKI